MQWIAQQSRISTLCTHRYVLFYGTKTYSFFGCSQHVHKVFMHMTFRCVNRLLQALCMKRNWLHEINFHCSLLTSFCYVMTSADVNPLHDNTLVKCYQIELLQTYYAIFYILTHFTHPLKMCKDWSNIVGLYRIKYLVKEVEEVKKVLELFDLLNQIK